MSDLTYQIMAIVGGIGVSAAGIYMGLMAPDKETRAFVRYAMGSPVLLLMISIQTRFFPIEVWAINGVMALAAMVALFTSWLSLFAGISMAIKPNITIRPTARSCAWRMIVSAMMSIGVIIVSGM